MKIHAAAGERSRPDMPIYLQHYLIIFNERAFLYIEVNLPKGPRFIYVRL